MKRFSPLKMPLLSAAALFVANAPSALACAACFGKSDSNMAKGMNMGIASLLAVIVTVLAGVACFSIFLAKRAARFPATDLSQSFAEQQTTVLTHD